MSRHRKRPSEDLILLLLVFPGLIQWWWEQCKNQSSHWICEHHRGWGWRHHSAQGNVRASGLGSWIWVWFAWAGERLSANLTHVPLVQKLFVLWVRMSQVQLLLDICLLHQCPRKYKLWLKLFQRWGLFCLHCLMNSHNGLSLQHFDTLLVRATNMISKIHFFRGFGLCQIIFNWASGPSTCWGEDMHTKPASTGTFASLPQETKRQQCRIGLTCCLRRLWNLISTQRSTWRAWDTEAWLKYLCFHARKICLQIK